MGADSKGMSSLFPEPDPRLADIPPINRLAAASFFQEEAATYAEVGEFFFRNPMDLASQVLVNWFTDIGLSSPERRWGALEMLAMYGLSAAEATGGLMLTLEQQDALVAAVVSDGPMKSDLERAARDALALLQSGADPSAELTANWVIYAHVLPPVFTAACLVLAVVTLQIVHEVADQEEKHPAVLWQEWLTSREGN